MHVGIILDGNRRYAKKRKIPPFLGHLYGKKNLEVFLKSWIRMKEPKYLTLYVFSLKNLEKRSKLEKNFIFKILEDGFKELLHEKDIYKFNVNVSFIGKLEKCKKSMIKVMNEVVKKTKKHKRKFLTFCVCYDGQDDIVNAVKLILKNKVNVTKRTIKKYLYTKNLPPLDLIIRTGGEKRLSGFLTWDSTYSELIFKKVMWPEYKIKMFIKDLNDFKKRKRRFGG